MEMQAKAELVGVIRERYVCASRKDKSRILDEFVAVTGHHRKHAVRLLSEPIFNPVSPAVFVGRKIYHDAVREVIVTLWESSDRLCGKRLKVILPDLLKSMEGHGHLNLDATLKSLVLRVSAATIDRLLRPLRERATGRKSTRPKRKTRAMVNVKTFTEWEDVTPGSLEVDFVAHCGGNLSGAFIHSLVATDVSSGWTECVPILIREQSLVVETMELLRKRFPFPIVGINTDNDSSFINESLIAYCKSKEIIFTRSRPYKKNDQAWIEQKNGAIVRRYLGYHRYSGAVACQTISHLYGKIRWYVNMFQPSFKLESKSRIGSKVKKKYHAPQTPCSRLINDPRVSAETKEVLRTELRDKDPLQLLHEIRKTQAALVALSCSEEVSTEQKNSLDDFLLELPRLWEHGESRPTHQPKPIRTRNYRTRLDPFEGDWSTILEWLQKEPDVAASTLLERLQATNPDKYADDKTLRTLQRRIGQWRCIMAKQLVVGTT